MVALLGTPVNNLLIKSFYLVRAGVVRVQYRTGSKCGEWLVMIRVNCFLLSKGRERIPPWSL